MGLIVCLCPFGMLFACLAGRMQHWAVDTEFGGVFAMMCQSLFTGWTGMATHQRAMDNTSNNIANVNTVGFKKNDFYFSTLFSKSYCTGNIPEGDTAGSINPKTCGVGVTTGAIYGNYREGPLEHTGSNLDVALTGNGFFLVGTTLGTALTRNGSFYLNNTHENNRRMLCVGEGLAVQGWNAVDGVVTPTTQVEDILLPALGDLLPGNVTSAAAMKGILPTSTDSSEFTGQVTNDLAVKGNLKPGSATLNTYVYAPVTQTDGTTSTKSANMEKIDVQITFSGPVLQGNIATWNWTMNTVNWPNPGDPAVQVYPNGTDTAFDRGAFGFYTQTDPAKGIAAGQPTTDHVNPGSARVSTTSAEGVTTYFTLPSNFELDVSLLTSLESAPGGDALMTWSVNGNPAGTMARTVIVYDEYTDFITSSDEAGNTIITPERRVRARENSLIFAQESATNVGQTWSWNSSMGGNGLLNFNTIGDLVSQEGTGPIEYDFSEVRSINYAGSMQVADQNGYLDGTLEDISIDQYGRVVGSYSNQVSQTLAQLAIGNVANPTGLWGSTGTLYYTSVASGGLMIGTAGDAKGSYTDLAAVGASVLAPGYLESSNVDLAEEFTELISIERAYQLNSRVVTTSDEMLQTAYGMKA